MTRPTAIVMMIAGIVLLGLGVAGVITTKPDATAAYGVLVGGFAGAGLALIVISGYWLIRWRGQSDEQIRVTMKQVFDERFYKASGRASRVTTLVTILFLAGCAAWCGVKADFLMAWLIIAAMLILGWGRLLLTRLFLRNQ